MTTDTRALDFLKILCPFCEAPWTENMLKMEQDLALCDSGGVYQNEVTLDITCNSCKKLIYKKVQDFND